MCNLSSNTNKNYYSEILGFHLNSFSNRESLCYYCHLFSLMFYILSAVYSQYGSDYVFVPPSDELVDLYDLLYADYKVLDRRKEIDDLRLSQFTAFKNLGDANYPYLTKLWKSSEKLFIEDKLALRTIIGKSEPPQELAPIIATVKHVLEDHLLEKQKTLNKYSSVEGYPLYWKGLKIDLNNAQLSYKRYKPVSVQLNNHEIKFLICLMQNKGNVVPYTALADFLGRFSGNVSGRDMQFVKKELFVKLNELKLNKNAIEAIKAMIKPQKNTGYKLA